MRYSDLVLDRIVVWLRVWVDNWLILKVVPDLLGDVGLYYFVFWNRGGGNGCLIEIENPVEFHCGNLLQLCFVPVWDF